MTETLTLPGAVATVGLTASGAALADPQDGRYFDHHGMMGWGGWPAGPIMVLIFFALLVGAVGLVVRLLRSDTSRSGAGSEDTAHTILRERFARGEIGEDEYEASRKVLDGKRHEHQ